MNSITNVMLFAALLGSFALGGCAAPSDSTEPGDEAEEETEVTSDALTQGTIPPSLSVTINDRTQQARSISRNVVVIRGLASNDGLAPSVASVKIDGDSFQVPVGATAVGTAWKIKTEVGAGYEARVVPGRFGGAYLTVRYSPL